MDAPIDSTGVAVVDWATATYINPVLNADFPDPAVILAPDG